MIRKTLFITFLFLAISISCLWVINIGFTYLITAISALSHSNATIGAQEITFIIINSSMVLPLINSFIMAYKGIRKKQALVDFKKWFHAIALFGIAGSIALFFIMEARGVELHISSAFLLLLVVFTYPYIAIPYALKSDEY